MMPDAAPSPLAVVEAILSRETNVEALAALAGAMRFTAAPAELDRTAIAFDANVLLRLSNHRRSEDIVDYLRTTFAGHLILPGQVVQEFWNNQFLAVDSLSSSIKKKADEITGLVSQIDSSYGNFSERFNAVLEEFHTSYGYVYDEQTLRRTNLFLNLLQEKAMVPFVPRASFTKVASSRKRTKTPPGFKDDLDGDFFVWSDLLLGLSTLQQSGKQIDTVALVTLDKKLDWSRNGVPHPLLTAEIKAVCGGTFEVLTIDALAQRLLG